MFEPINYSTKRLLFTPLEVMDGSDARRSVADCGGCAPLAARVGLAMLPVMDRCPNHSRITTEYAF